MRDPSRDICPRQTTIGLPPTHDRQYHRHSVELSRLLEQIRVVVSLPAHGRGGYLVDLFASQGVFFSDVEARVHGEACRKHPALDNEGPGVEGDDWREEGGGTDGLHGCVGVSGIGFVAVEMVVSLQLVVGDVRLESIRENIYCLQTEVLYIPWLWLRL